MNSRVLLLVSLVLLVGASILGYMAYRTTADAQAQALAAQRKAESSADEGRTAMVVLGRAVKAFEVLSPADLVIERVMHPLPGSATDAQVWQGRMVMADLPAGTALNETHFNPGGQVARLLRPGERAVAIPVNDVVGGGGFLQPGDIVDIILFLDGEEGRRASTQVVMRGVRVLSFGASLIDVSPDVSDKEKDEQSANAERRLRDARTAVLAIAQADVSRLMLANSLGELRLAIVPTEELRQSAATGMEPKGNNSSAMLPVVDVLSVPSRKTAVPEQRFYLTESALQFSQPRSSPSSSARSPRSLPIAQTVIIIRGLSSESK